MAGFVIVGVLFVMFLRAIDIAGHVLGVLLCTAWFLLYIAWTSCREQWSLLKLRYHRKRWHRDYAARFPTARVVR